MEKTSANTVAHISGNPIVLFKDEKTTIAVQRCALCGTKLSDSSEPSRYKKYAGKLPPKGSQLMIVTPGLIVIEDYDSNILYIHEENVVKVKDNVMVVEQGSITFCDDLVE